MNDDLGLDMPRLRRQLAGWSCAAVIINLGIAAWNLSRGYWYFVPVSLFAAGMVIWGHYKLRRVERELAAAKLRTAELTDRWRRRLEPPL